MPKTPAPASRWERYRRHCLRYEDLGFSIDISRMDFADDFFDSMAAPAAEAITAMEALESGAIANPDEGRMVGHYWLRAPQRAPDEELKNAIESDLAAIEDFARKIHTGELSSPGGAPFSRLLLIGIGGSALGPQLLADALAAGGSRAAMGIH
ncbi:MAG: hypothetical protein ACC661_06290 [Verrucomicrobiales bacterium]